MRQSARRPSAAEKSREEATHRHVRREGDVNQVSSDHLDVALFVDRTLRRLCECSKACERETASARARKARRGGTNAPPIAKSSTPASMRGSRTQWLAIIEFSLPVTARTAAMGRVEGSRGEREGKERAGAAPARATPRGGQAEGAPRRRASARSSGAREEKNERCARTRAASPWPER